MLFVKIFKILVLLDESRVRVNSKLKLRVILESKSFRTIQTNLHMCGMCVILLNLKILD